MQEVVDEDHAGMDAGEEGEAGGVADLGGDDIYEAEAGAQGRRAAAAELTKAPNGRKAQEASGRRRQGANGRAQASGTRLNGRAACLRHLLL